ncbi:YbbR-like domain-containing protein [Paenibacillus sp. GCM10012306]|uniref:CdaR family protein n=1 Tax=Paenibacillus sp. GCM10012306 TaxID=3317342 RepID=UPI00360A9F20
MNKWMNNNNFNKILALALGIILWAMVHADTAPVSQTTTRMESKTIENVKIELSGFDEEKYVMDPLDVDSVRMEVRGKKSDLNYKFSDSYKVSVDLSKVKPGDNRLPLSYSLPNGVTLESLTPDEVNVHVELRNTKAFPITLLTRGTPAQGYQLGTPVIQPTGEAEVTLAASELSKVAKVQGTVELDGDSETFKEKRMKLFAYDSNGNEIKDAVIKPAYVSVEIPITLPFKSVPLEIGYTGQLPESLVLSQVKADQTTVTVYGQKEALATLTAYEATVNLSQIKSAGTEQFKVELVPPAGIDKIEPGKVNVTVTTSDNAERTLEGVPIKLEGAADGLKATLIDPADQTLSLTVSGAPDLLNQLNVDKISVVADVSNLAAGAHEVSLQVSLPKFIALKQSPGQQLKVTVQLQSSSTPEVSTEPSQNSSTGGSPSTPEPSAEPVIGEGKDPGDQPTHSGETSGTPTPTPTEQHSENSGSTNGNAGTGNNGEATGTGGT